MDFHPLADLFPLLEGGELAELTADVKTNGLQYPIVRHEGKILDGRNRWLACEKTGVEPRFTDYDGPDPLAFVVSANLHRRHMNIGQRGLVAARLANMTDGQKKSDKPGTSIEAPETPAVSIPDAAKILGVSPATVERAKTVLSKAVPEVVKLVESGEVKIHAAREVASLPPERQRDLAARGPAAVKEAAAQKDRSRPCRNNGVTVKSNHVVPPPVVESPKASPEPKPRKVAEPSPVRESVQTVQAPPPEPEPSHPHSDRLVAWLRSVVRQTLIIETELGGLPALLSEPDKWDWREVKEYVLPMLDAHAETIARYRKEIADHADR